MRLTSLLQREAQGEGILRKLSSLQREAERGGLTLSALFL